MKVSIAVELAALVGAASAGLFRLPKMDVGPIDEAYSDDTHLLASNGTNGWGTFDQLLDHANPALGTFKQRFWYGSQYWKGPGSPVFLVNPGEQAADGFNVTYTTAMRLTGLMAQAVGGAVVVLEHRYWGESAPYEDLTVERLQYLTLENSIKDNTYFARNFDAPFDNTSSSSAADAPWVYTGGSYSGALAGWIATVDPGTFWAYSGSSGVVEAVGDFWEYFVPVQEATPQNCSSDLSAVIDYIDGILINGTDADKTALKSKFMLQDLVDVDFASALQNGPWLWQSTQFYNTNITGFTPYYQFCDYIEGVGPNSTNAVPGAEGVGASKALDGYAKWFTEDFLPFTCESYGYADWQGEFNTQCFASLNASNPVYQDRSVDNPFDRQWVWMTCNEPFEFWQDGAPADRPSIVSRLVDVKYSEDICALFFPDGFGLAAGKTADDVNAYTGGWDETRNTTRLGFTNGGLDPWRDATVSSIFRPGGPLQSTPELPVRLVTNGTHCSNLYGQNWAVNAGVKKIADDETANMKEWIAEFYTAQGKPLPWTL